MAAPQERSRKFELNPRTIRPKAVQAVVADLAVQTPSTYLKILADKRIEGTHFAEIIHPEFQVFRIGALGFELPITPEDRDRYGITVENISSLGREDTKVPEQEDIGWDSVGSINTMRAFVASAFFEEAAMQGLPTPEINDGLIDPLPVKKHQIEGAVASEPGMFLYEWEELEARWAEENPALYQATVELKDKLRDYYVERMITTYRDLPQAYMDSVAPEVRDTYDDYLMGYALRTYAMFAPHPPTLIEVKKVKSLET